MFAGPVIVQHNVYFQMRPDGRINTPQKEQEFLMPVSRLTGLFLYGAGSFLFWPAALGREYGFFLFALFVIASGSCFLKTASNSFIALLGDPRNSERRLNFSQAFSPRRFRNRCINRNHLYLLRRGAKQTASCGTKAGGHL
jgi:hypothetical protein